MRRRRAHGHESPHIVPIPAPLVVGEGFMPSRERAGINPAPTVDEGGRRPDEGDFLTDDTEQASQKHALGHSHAEGGVV